jgi:hypothetical protein
VFERDMRQAGAKAKRDGVSYRPLMGAVLTWRIPEEKRDAETIRLISARRASRRERSASDSKD